MSRAPLFAQDAAMESALSRVRTHKLVRGTAAGEAAAQQLVKRHLLASKPNELLQ